MDLLQEALTIFYPEVLFRSHFLSELLLELLGLAGLHRGK